MDVQNGAHAFWLRAPDSAEADRYRERSAQEYLGDDPGDRKA